MRGTLHHHVLSVGRRARDPLLDAAEVYAQRIQHYARLTRVTVKESDPEREAEALLRKAPPRAYIVALDEHGEQLSTRQLAQRLETWQQAGQRDIVWIMGGADGLASAIKTKAHWVWSLSTLTLPHRLAQVVALEQLYRGHSILHGARYHRD